MPNEISIEGLEKIVKLDLSLVEVMTGYNDVKIQEKINEVIDKVNRLIDVEIERINLKI